MKLDVPNVVQWTANSERSQKLDDIILRLIIEEALPVSFVESQALFELLKITTNGKYKLVQF